MKRKNILIISLCFILLIIGIGYSAFSSKLNINSSSSITSNWDVEITSIEQTNNSGNIVEKNKSFTKDTATFNVEMEKPGNYVYYKIGVTNKGSIPAIATLGSLTCSNDSFLCNAYADSNVSTDIKTNTNLTNSRLIIDSNETEYYNVYIKFKNEITEMPENLINKLTLNLIYKQSDVGITHKDNCYTGKVLKNGTLSITDYDETCGTDVVIPENIDGYTVTEIASGSYKDNVGSIGSFNNKKITSVTMPDTIVKVGAMSFMSNKITTLKLSNNLESIEFEAFQWNKIKTINLPATLKYIGDSAFSSNRITNIIIPSGVTNLGGGAFAGNNVTGKDAFIYGRNNDGSTDYTTLNSYAGKDNLETVIPQNVTTIMYRAFRNTNIKEIDIPSNVQRLDSYAFNGCYLTKVTLHEGLKFIGGGAFYASSLTEINIPNSVESIGAKAFILNKLKTVTIGTGVKTIGADAFKTEQDYNPIETITINQKEGSITGSPWGSNATIKWLG